MFNIKLLASLFKNKTNSVALISIPTERRPLVDKAAQRHFLRIEGVA
jgi:hypothetical protein